MKNLISNTKKYLTMQYLKTKRAVVALTALLSYVREPIQAGDQVNLILARRSQVCNNGHIKNNPLSVFLAVHLEGVVATPKTARSAIMIVLKEYNELPSLAMEMCR